MKRLSKSSIAAAAVAIIVAGSTVACSGSSDKKSAQKSEAQAAAQGALSLLQNQPPPVFTRSQMRANMIELETAEAQGVQTTSFFFNQGQRDPQQVCPSIGVPIPNTASLTNPQQTEKHSESDGGNVTLGQMDPNGTYVPAASSGTFVMCVNSDGTAYANYWEGFVQTVFAPATWDDTTHTVKILGPATFHFTTK